MVASLAGSQRRVLSLYLYRMTEQWRAGAPEWPEGSAVERPGQAEAAAARCASRGRPTLATRPLPSPGYGPLGETLRSTRARGPGADFPDILVGRAALKVDCPNSSRGGKRGSSPSRKHSKKSSIEDVEDGDSRSSESPSNTFGFVAYSVNTGEKSRVKVKSHQSYSTISHSERSGSPTPSPSPRKLRCLDQREIENERHEHCSKKRRARDYNPHAFDSHWLG